jgi:purine-binding chemotaxis protein CheW
MPAVNPISGSYVLFNLDKLSVGLPLAAVERVERAVEITPLPKAPEIVLGVVNVRGRVVPVVDIRKRFELSQHPLDPRDHLILARTLRRPVALAVDQVAGVQSFEADRITPSGEILPGLEYVEGVARIAEGMILIHDLDRFLSLEEDEALGKSLKGLP